MHEIQNKLHFSAKTVKSESGTAIDKKNIFFNLIKKIVICFSWIKYLITIFYKTCEEKDEV